MEHDRKRLDQSHVASEYEAISMKVHTEPCVSMSFSHNQKRRNVEQLIWFISKSLEISPAKKPAERMTF